MSLRQNENCRDLLNEQFSYQSECHCAKTVLPSLLITTMFSYQSECHCAKTASSAWPRDLEFSYQSECHCAKTYALSSRQRCRFSYQSECHCAKTNVETAYSGSGLVTSQNVTAPKHAVAGVSMNQV